MDRRSLLTSLGSLAAISGCIGTDNGDSDETSTVRRDRTTRSTSDPSTTISDTETPSTTLTDPDVTREGLSIDESIGFGDVEVVVTDAAVTRRLVGPNEETVSDRGLYALAHVSATNEGDSTRSHPRRSAFSALTGSDQYDSTSLSQSELTDPIEGDVYSYIEDAHPGVEASGWVGFELPTDFARVELGLSYSPTFDDEYEPAYWNLDVSADEAALLQYDGLIGPDVVEFGETAAYDVSVENRGGRTGRLTREYTFYRSNATLTIPEYEEATIEIPPGETVTRSFEFDPDELTAYSFEFGKFEREFEVQTADLEFGETLAYPGGAEVTLSHPHLSDICEFEDDSISPEEGNQFAYVHYQAVNETDDSADVFYESLLRTESTIHEIRYRPIFSDNQLVEPVTGTWVKVESHLSPGEEVEGWLVFEIDEDVVADEISITGDEPGDGDSWVRWS